MSTDIRTPLEAADRERPHLKEINTFASCLELLELALHKAGPEWAFVGKSLHSGKDGSGIRPGWFTPVVMSLVRPDGQREDVLIDGVSQDAAWHIPTRQQYKVIANSTANEPGPWDHGPAKLTPYKIDELGPTGERQYRWHNPPIPQPDAAIVPGTPGTPTPPPAPVMVLPERGEMMQAGELLHRFYKAPEGLQRPLGLWKPESASSVAQPDWEGIGAWLFDVYLKARVAGKNATEAFEEMTRQIRASDEWKSKHPGETR